MPEPIESRVAALLRDAPDQSLPLAILHERLRDESPYSADGAALLAVLERRTDLFVTVAPGEPFGDEPAWERHERTEYRAALTAVGMAAEPRVALCVAAPAAAALDVAPAPGAPPHALSPAEHALLAIWSEAAHDEAVRTDVGIALAELDRMRARLGAARPVDENVS